MGLNSLPGAGRPTLVYDGDCGFCARCAALARRLANGRYDVRAWQDLDLAAAGLTAADCVAAAQWVDPGHEPVAGHRAIAAALRQGPWWCRPVGSLLGAPALQRPAAATYRWVATHRHRLPGGSASCRRP